MRALAEDDRKEFRMHATVWERVCGRLGINPDVYEPGDVLERLTDDEIEDLVAAWWRG